MIGADRRIEGDWFDGKVPTNVRMGHGAWIESAFSFSRYRSRCEIGFSMGRGSALYTQSLVETGPRGRVVLGDYSCFNGGIITADERVEIGSYVLISWNVAVLDTYRAALDPALRRTAVRHALMNGVDARSIESETKPVIIGDNVWIGFESCILPGVTIGKGSVIGARSMVAEDVPEYAVAVGNPARVIRKLNDNNGVSS